MVDMDTDGFFDCLVFLYAVIEWHCIVRLPLLQSQIQLHPKTNANAEWTLAPAQGCPINVFSCTLSGGYCWARYYLQCQLSIFLKISPPSFLCHEMTAKVTALLDLHLHYTIILWSFVSNSAFFQKWTLIKLLG